MAELIILAQLFIGLGMMLSTGPEPAPPPAQHSPAVNLCYGIKVVDGRPVVDYTQDKCAAARARRAGNGTQQ